MLKGKTALISGASKGIGRSIALKFAEHGAYVGINYFTNESSAKEILKDVINLGGDGVILKGDISNFKHVEKIVTSFVKITDHIDILVNNAGVYYRNSFENITNDNWDNVISINLSGSFYLCKKIIPYMHPQSKIIFISSQLAFRGSSHGSDYAASKAGMLGLMRSLSFELGERNILVNAIAPGVIDTDIIADYSIEKRKERIKEIPLGRLGNPEDVANTCLFLASDLSTYITGETINVNGGLYIH